MLLDTMESVHEDMKNEGEDSVTNLGNGARQKIRKEGKTAYALGATEGLQEGQH